MLIVCASAKYPLALLNHVLDNLGDDLGIGYDIGCGFAETADRSKMVGPKVRSRRAKITPNAFHGWLHHRLCQVQHHPLYQDGYGIEDLEEMERIFSSSNNVARCTRFASIFHWMQFFDLHFSQWDSDKYEELSMYSNNSYPIRALIDCRQLFVQQLSAGHQDHRRFQPGCREAEGGPEYFRRRFDILAEGRSIVPP